MSELTTALSMIIQNSQFILKMQCYLSGKLNMFFSDDTPIQTRS